MAQAIFDHKIFNGEVFKGYVDRIPNTTRTELIKSRAIRNRPDLAAAMADQTGGNYITTQLRGLISGTPAQNYDGSTDITSTRSVSGSSGASTSAPVPGLIEMPAFLPRARMALRSFSGSALAS